MFTSSLGSRRFAACDQGSHRGFFPRRSVFLVYLGAGRPEWGCTTGALPPCHLKGGATHRWIQDFLGGAQGRVHPGVY